MIGAQLLFGQPGAEENVSLFRETKKMRPRIKVKRRKLSKGVNNVYFPLSGATADDTVLNLIDAVIYPSTINSATYTLQSPVRPFLKLLNNKTSWFTNTDDTQLSHQLSDESFNIFSRHGQTMRQQIFIKEGSLQNLLSCQHLKLATVIPSKQNEVVTLCLFVFTPTKFQSPHLSILDILKSWKNPHLWDNSGCDSNSGWPCSEVSCICRAMDPI